MRLEIASHSAIKYALYNWHYAKSIPAGCFGYAVFEDDQWCGVICYGRGANNHIAKPYGFSQGQVLELVRVALNGKQSSTSKAVSISLKLLKKDCPLASLVVSYADVDQGHTGIIYQATNWYYEGLFNVGQRTAFIIFGKKTHPRSVSNRGIKQSLPDIRRALDPNAKKFRTKGKHKYLYPLTSDMRMMCKKRSKPYPNKQATVA